MAKKRLNKKLVTILSLFILTFVVIAVVAVINYKFKDPQPFLVEALVLVDRAQKTQAANEAKVTDISDPKVAYENLAELNKESSDLLYKEAIESLGQAIRFSRGNAKLRYEAQQVLADLYVDLGAYPAATAVWKKMFEQNNQDYQVKKNEVDVMYEAGKNGMAVWPDLRAEADVLIDLNESLSLNDPYGYIVRAHADIMMIRTNLAKDVDELTDEARDLLNKALEIDDKALEAYKLLAELVLLDVESTIDQDAIDRLNAGALEYYRQGLAMNPDDPEAYVAILEDYLYGQLVRRYQAVQTADTVGRRDQLAAAARSYDQDSVAPVLDEALRLFPEDGRFVAYQGRMALIRSNDLDGLNHAIELYSRALELDDQDADIYLRLAGALRLRYDQQDRADTQDSTDLERAYTLLREALYLKSMQATQGPRRLRIINTRLSLLDQLIDTCCLLVESRAADTDGADADVASETASSNYLEVARTSLKQLSEILGADHVLCKIASGAVAMAQGDVDTAVRDFYDADIMEANADRSNAALKVRMFEALRQTSYKTLALRYAAEAMASGQRSPGLLHDYLETMTQLPGGRNAGQTLQMIEALENAVAQGNRQMTDAEQRDLKLFKARMLLRLPNRRADALEVLASLPAEDREVAILRAQSLPEASERAAAMEAVFARYPDALGVASALIDYYMTDTANQKPQYGKARALLDQLLVTHPDDLALQELKMVLDSDDPGAIDPAARRAMRLKLLESIEDDGERHSQLARYYRGMASQETGDAAKAYMTRSLDQYRQALKVRSDDVTVLGEAVNVAIALEDWDTAEQYVLDAGEVDPSVGMLLEGYLLSARQQWDDAAARLTAYLETHPISSQAHMQLARIYFSQGRTEAAMDEATTAVFQDASNVDANLLRAQLLHQANVQKGLDRLDEADIVDVISHIDRVLELQPNNETARQLRTVYYPLWIAIKNASLADDRFDAAQKEKLERQVDQVLDLTVSNCRAMIRENPADIRNWRILVDLYQQQAQQSTDPARAEQYRQLATDVFKEAMAANPDSSELAMYYGFFLIDIDQKDHAADALSAMMSSITDPEEKAVATVRLGRVYLRLDDYDRAESLLRSVIDSGQNQGPALAVLGELYNQQQAYDKAAEIYAQAYERTPHPATAARRVEMLVMNEQFDQAVEAYDAYAQEFPDKRVLGLVGARLAIVSRDYDTAIARADTMLAADSSDIDALTLKARAQAAAGRLDAALATVQQLRTIVPADSNVGRLLLVQLYWQLGRYDQAMAELESGLGVDPDWADGQDRLVKALRLRGQWMRLERFCQDRIEQYPDEVFWYVQAGDAIRMRAEQYRQNGQTRQADRQSTRAIDMMKQALSLAGRTGRNADMAMQGLLECLSAAGRYADAVKLVDDNLQNAPSDLLLLLLKAKALYRMDQPAGAVAAYDKAFDYITPATADYLIGQLSQVGHTDTMIAWAQKRLAADPQQVYLSAALSSLYAMKGDYAKETAQLESALDSASDAQRQLAIKRLLLISYGRTAPDKAVTLGQEILADHPDDVGVLNNLAYILLDIPGRESEALEMAARVYRMMPTNPNVMDTYAAAQIANGEFAPALGLLDQAMLIFQERLQEPPAELLYHQALGLAGQGDTAAAEEKLVAANDRLATELSASVDRSALQEKLQQLAARLRSSQP